MKQTLKNLTVIAAISFAVSFATGMSASIIYQEHQSLKPIIAAQQDATQELSELPEILFAAADDSSAF